MLAEACVIVMQMGTPAPVCSSVLLFDEYATRKECVAAAVASKMEDHFTIGPGADRATARYFPECHSVEELGAMNPRGTKEFLRLQKEWAKKRGQPT